MVLDVILIFITLIVLLIASYSDIKYLEVPDWLSYGLIFGALGIRAIFSIAESWNILLSGILGFAVCFALACLFYYTSQWGGGDSKLLMGMGMVIGITYPFNVTSWNLLLFFVGLLMLGAIYGLFWIIYIAISKRKLFSVKFKEYLNEYKKVHVVLGIVSVILLIIFLFGIFGIKNGYSFFWPIIPFPLASFYLFLFVTTVENSCFIKKISIEQLTEGDWLAEDVVVGDKIVLKKKTLEKEDLTSLLHLKKERKLEKVLVREGIPFVPSFLFSFLVYVFGRNIYSWFIESFL